MTRTKDIYLALMVFVMLLVPMCVRAYTPPVIPAPNFNILQYCASGSQEQTTGTITGGTSVLTLAAVKDFQNCVLPTGAAGTGITIYHAGPNATISSPTGLVITQGGTPGSTSHGYQIVANDFSGGTSIPGSLITTTTSNATLSVTNYNILCWTPPSGAESYSIFRDGTYLVTMFDSIPVSLTLCYYDTNQTANGQGWGNAATGLPDWFANTTVPLASLPDWCQTTIANGAGSTTLNLTATCPNSASGQIVKHDDTTAINYALTLCETINGGTVLFPTGGNYNMGNVSWPYDANRGWIILDNEGQITLTYPITFGSTPSFLTQNRIRITGGSGGGGGSGQFFPINTGQIYTPFISPAIHFVYENSVPLVGFGVDHIAINNRGIGGDGIIADGGTGYIYIDNVDLAVDGTAFKFGGAETSAAGTTGSCTVANGFGIYMGLKGSNVLTTFYDGNPLVDCDGWTIDFTGGLSTLENLELVGQGVHTEQLGNVIMTNVLEEAGTTTGFITWDTSQGTSCSPSCNTNVFSNITLADQGSGANVYFIDTVNGSSSVLVNSAVDIEEVTGIQTQLIGGVTPLATCWIVSNGPAAGSNVPGMCTYASGLVNGFLTSFIATGHSPITVTSVSPVSNLTAQYTQSTQITAVTGSLGGSPVAAGVCIQGAATISGSISVTSGMTLVATPAADPGTGFTWLPVILGTNTLVVRVCNVSGTTATPTAEVYQVRTLQ